MALLLTYSVVPLRRLVTRVLLLLLLRLLPHVKLMVVELLLMLWRLWQAVVHVPVLVLVTPHWTASITEHSIGFRYLAHATVVLTVLVSNHTAISTTTTHGPRSRKCLPNGILCLNTDVMTHLVIICRKGLLSGNMWYHVLVLLLTWRLHLEWLKVSTEVKLIHKGWCCWEAIIIQTFQPTYKEVGVIKEVHGGAWMVKGVPF